MKKKEKENIKLDQIVRYAQLKNPLNMIHAIKVISIIPH